jgi:hypothetical protein
MDIQAASSIKNGDQEKVYGFNAQLQIMAGALPGAAVKFVWSSEWPPGYPLGIGARRCRSPLNFPKREKTRGSS